MPPVARRRRERGLHLYSAKEFSSMSYMILGSATSNPTTKKHSRRFKATFGIPPRLVAQLWQDIAQSGYLNHLGPRSLKPIHLLWALCFLKGYNAEETNAYRVSCDEKTFRKWAWFYSKCIADLESKYVSPRCNYIITCSLLSTMLTVVFVSFQINWQNRFRGGDALHRCLTTVDGTDFRIGNPTPFKKVWYTKKFNGPGLRYELL